MKNKRTKLTAILLSALMAVSTISSVTWAADLFSDGSVETDVEAEEPKVIPNVEDEIEADDAVLAGVGADDFESVVFQYDDNDAPTKVVAVFTLDSTKYPGKDPIIVDAKTTDVDLPATCELPRRAVYRAEYQFEGESGTGFYVDSDMGYLDKDSSKGEVTVATAAKSWKYSDGSAGKILENGLIVVPGSNMSTLTGKNGHVASTGVGTFDARSSSCTDIGLKLSYYYCIGCKALLIDNTSTPVQYTFTGASAAKELKTPEDVLKAIEDADGQINSSDFVIDGQTVNSITVDINGATVTIASTEYSSHVYDTNPITLTDEYFTFEYNENGTVLKSSNYSRNSDTYVKIVANGDATQYTGKGGDSINYKPENGGDMLQFAPLNCIGTQIADPENGRDAYYYQVVKCKYCNTVKYYNVEVIKDVTNGIIGDFYERVDKGNIIGFFAKNDKNTIYLFKDILEKSPDGKQDWNSNQWYTYFTGKNYKVFIKDKISADIVSDTPEPVFALCGKMGYYYVRTYEKDTPKYVNEKLIEVESNHAWGKVELVLEGKEFIDKTKSLTENKKLLPIETGTPANAQSNEYVVVRDSAGNVTEAKSLNCITTAKYQLGQQCAICGQWKKYGDLKTAGPNTDRHDYGDWSTTTDDSDDKYYQIQGEEHDTYHMRYTYYHRTCKLCGKRDLQLALEKKEAHELRETKYDDDYDKDGVDSTYEAPTCGKPGHYDVIYRCACRYEDTNTRKQTTIPPTDKHDFSGNKVELVIKGDVQVSDFGFTQKDYPYGVYAEVVRKCNNCEEYDSNGISNTPVGQLGVDADLRIDNVNEGRTIEIIKSRKDSNGNSFPCLPDTAKITFNWSGKVDGKETIADTVETTVPYYPDLYTYAARRNHQLDFKYNVVVKPTATQEGSREKITFCTVCDEVISKETETVAKLGSAPSVKATAVNYNTITVTWDAVDGAESYKIYNKSNALGISKWQLVATVDGTSYTDTGLVTGAKYRYTVKPVVNGVGGDYSKKGVIVCPRLTAPEIKSVTAVSTNKNKITWTKVDGASGYIVQRKAANGSWTRIATVRGGSNINCRDKKAVAGASYRVRAFRTVEKPNFVKSNVYGPFSVAK